MAHVRPAALKTSAVPKKSSMAGSLEFVVEPDRYSE